MNLDIDPQTLAKELARRLNEHLPKDFRLEADGPTLVFYGADGPYSRTDFELNLDGGNVAHDRVGAIVGSFLDQVQADVAHATRGTAWPYLESASPEPLPMEWVEISGFRAGGGDIRFGYGESGPTFEPILLADITRGS